MIRRILCATGLLLLAPAPAHAWMNARSNTPVGSSVLNGWTGTSSTSYASGWDAADARMVQRMAASSAGYITQPNGKVRIGGNNYNWSFDPPTMRELELGKELGHIGVYVENAKLAGIGGFLAGAVTGRKLTGTWQGTLLGGWGTALTSAFAQAWSDMVINHRDWTPPNSVGGPTSNTNCPCSTGGGGDTGTGD
jgi:hypothetical protein